MWCAESLYGHLMQQGTACLAHLPAMRCLLADSITLFTTQQKRAHVERLAPGLARPDLRPRSA